MTYDRLLLCTEVWHIVNYKIYIEMYDNLKSVKIFTNETKFVENLKLMKSYGFHRRMRFSRMKHNFTENVTAMKS